uniref:Uncharacterized protein n=1 Tax=Salmo trutta TaxID=8032 RepID=A0A674C2A5_SALTR
MCHHLSICSRISALSAAKIVDSRCGHLDGTGDDSLVKEPRATVLALDYDPVQNKVYLASTVLKQIDRADLDCGSWEVLLTEGLDSPKGLAVDCLGHYFCILSFSLSTLDRSTFDGINRENVISNGIKKPRGIAVHPLAKYNIFNMPVVQSASLEGSDHSVIAGADLLSSSGQTLNLHILILIPSSLLVDPGRPFDLVVFEDRLWITDWKQQLLLSVYKQTGMNPEFAVEESAK